MNVYSDYKLHQTYLKENAAFLNVVEDKEKAEWLITGRFEQKDYHKTLKGIIVPFSGTDKIDRAFLKKHGLKLFNTTAHAIFVAEMAVKLTLGLMGSLSVKDQKLKQGDWSYYPGITKKPHWTTLVDKKIGIFGYGHIGKNIKKLLTPFTNTFYTIDRGKDYDDCLLVSDLNSLVVKSDVVIIAAPLNEYTKGIFDETVLNTMKETFLINVGRGEIVAEKALYEALKKGTLKGFAADVWYQYPSKETPVSLPSTYPIHQFDNVLMSPHCGGFSEQFEAVVCKSVLNQLKRLKDNDTSGSLPL